METRKGRFERGSNGKERERGKREGRVKGIMNREEGERGKRESRVEEGGIEKKGIMNIGEEGLNEEQGIGKKGS